MSNRNTKPTNPFKNKNHEEVWEELLTNFHPKKMNQKEFFKMLKKQETTNTFENKI